MERAESATVAAFDFDGTLTSSDSFIGFCRLVAGPRSVARALAGAAVRRPEEDLSWRDGMKARLIAKVMAGRHLEEVEATAASYGEILARQITAPMRMVLDRHRRSGDRLVVVSASLELYLAVAAERLGMHHVIGTRLEVGPDGRLTGRLEGSNCRGPEKARRLRAWLAEEGIGEAAIVAYGNSRGDRELLAMAASANRVRRGRPLTTRQEASAPTR
jgi:phosphatidylglycerophosphatase C